MDHTYILWIATFAYALHILEEYMFNRKDWAAGLSILPISWSDFAVVNGSVIVLGICCSSVGWQEPGFALSLPALMIINATFSTLCHL